MKRDEALSLVKQRVENKNLIKHMLACESCMRGMARHFKEDEERWGLAGLLHDLDYPETVNNPEKHGFTTVEMLKEKGIDNDILNAILAHPGHKTLETLMERSLYSVDPLTGLIVAAVLMHPQKKISYIDTEFIMRRYKEKRFAAGVNRDQIAIITETGVSLEDFIGICLSSMKEIAGDLGL
ncbi:MAG: phosphohydrolase [bacterium (Candidatus Stahlbacteria) CG23_combo_of_CG06-09_8_20_14_all_34_7]|nr:MAG: phosphohydrolase [bacterium (Candidatus Stahlbacteria) CG23_combo_of_CG06-09_8_20_14_all_34_7]